MKFYVEELWARTILSEAVAVASDNVCSFFSTGAVKWVECQQGEGVVVGLGMMNECEPG